VSEVVCACVRGLVRVDESVLLCDWAGEGACVCVMID